MDVALAAVSFLACFAAPLLAHNPAASIPFWLPFVVFAIRVNDRLEERR